MSEEARATANLSLSDLLAENRRLRRKIARQAEMERALQQRTEALSFLHQAGQQLSVSLELDRALRAVLDEARDLMQITACSIWLRDPGTLGIVCAGVSSQPEAARRVLLGWRLAAGQGAAGWVMAHGRSLLLRDAPADPRFFPGVDEKTGLATRSLLTVPLLRNDETIGVLQLLDRRPDRFDDKAQQLMEQLAASIATAVDNLRLYKQAERELATRIKAEEKVRQQRDFLDAVLESLTHPFYVINPATFTVMRANSAAKKKGITAGVPYDRLHGGDCEGKGRLFPARAILQTKTAVQGEHVHCDADGNPRNVLVHAYPLRNDEGEITAIIEYTMDVTGHVQAKEMLMRSERFAAAGKLAAAVAHEIKNPLQSVLGCLGLAEEALKEDRDPAKYFDVARDALRRVSGTVGQMRDLYRPLAAEKEPVDVNALLRQLLTLVEPQGESNNVALRLNPDPDLPPIMAFADQLDQVFLNLLLNGIEAMPEGGDLVVTTRFTESPPGVAVSVADEGEGIPAQDLPHVFDPFFTTKYDGSGLGLAVSVGIIDQHGGWIDVESEAGVGSTFTVWTPA